MLSKRIRTLLLSILVVTMLLPAQAFAAAAINVYAETSLQVQIAPDGKPQEGVELRLYRVADVSRTCRFTLAGAFEDYSVSLNDNTSAGWRELATTLDGYVRTDGVAADAVVKTRANGVAAFTGLTTGLYLVTGDRWYDTSTHYYTPTPFLISLPDLDAKDHWVYDAAVNAKLVPGEDGPGGEPEYTRVSVLKIWDDDDSEQRPTEIVVELYDGETLEDTVTLSKENNWQHTWTRLDDDGEWIVREKEVPEGYTVSVEKQNTRFVLTNTLDDDPPPPDDPVDPPPPDDPVNPPPPDDPPGDPPSIPQTGVLWWPVPMLMAAGLLLMLLGMLRRRNAYED